MNIKTNIPAWGGGGPPSEPDGGGGRHEDQMAVGARWGSRDQIRGRGPYDEQGPEEGQGAIWGTVWHETTLRSQQSRILNS